MNSVVILSKEENILFNGKIELGKKFAKIIHDQRTCIVAVFKTWGFGDWFTFKKIILHFYPQVSENELYEFYTGLVVRQDVLKYVYYVYQIFQK